MNTVADPVLSAALAPLAIIISALLAWVRHEKVTARQAAIDFVVHAEYGSPNWREGRSVFTELAAGDGLALIALADPRDHEQIENSVKVAQYLNQCELAAIAIEEKAMDETMYKKLHRTSFVKTWKIADAYIEKRRIKQNQESLYKHFEALAKKWAAE